MVLVERPDKGDDVGRVASALQRAAGEAVLDPRAHLGSDTFSASARDHAQRIGRRAWRSQ